jgi:hypothetical protein
MNNIRLVTIGAVLLMDSLSTIGIQQVFASSRSPYESGFDHGCDDSNKAYQDRYINEPGKGPSFHTDSFMRGYNDGLNCSNEDEEAVAADEEEESNGSSGGDGLKVKVYFDRRDNACVRTADDSHRAGCSSGQAGDTATFQFNSGDVEEGEKVCACFQAYDDDCKSVINGEEKGPIDIYQGSNDSSQLPQCDGSFQDCITQRGDFCVAGSTEDKCEIEALTL